MVNIDRVIELVNAARTALDMPLIYELPTGKRYRAGRCPIFNALDQNENSSLLSVFSHAVFEDPIHAKIVARAWGEENREGNAVKIPDEILQFILAFDNGKFPEYVG